MAGQQDNPQQAAGGMRPAEMVRSFHKAFGLPISTTPTLNVGQDLLSKRQAFLDEEVSELREAVDNRDLVATADALADIVYVVYGTAVTLGIPLDACVAEVHRSNITKIDGGGRPLVETNGKAAKRERYEPPDIAGVLRSHQQGNRGHG